KCSTVEARDPDLISRSPGAWPEASPSPPWLALRKHDFEGWKRIELSHPEDAITAVKFDPANPNLLLVSSWDKTVKLYNLSNPSPTEPISVYPHPSPVLDVCFGTGKNAGRGYTASLDRGVREIDLESTSASPTSNSRPNRVISTHQDAVKCVHYSSEFDILISGSWDRSVVLQDPKSSSNKQYPNQICSLTLPNLPAKVFCLDASKDKLVVAMGNRRIWIWDLLKLSESLMINLIRILIWLQPKLLSHHHHSRTRKLTQIHDPFGTFATGGGDGIVSIWDSAAKKRLRQLPKYPGSITSLAFNSDGSKLAIACSILEEENPANNPDNNETDHSSDPNNKKESSDEDMKDSSAAPAAAGDPDKKIDSHINSLKNCVFIRNVIDDCKPRTK
ncbi:hypothetical protein PSTT_06099, partial [Puccinia striiformis]